MAKIGVWENRRFIGAVVYGDGVLGCGKHAYGVPKIEIAQLVRLALREHKTPCSRIIRVSIKLLTEAMPGLRLLVSFADTGQDHLGTIYQAANWVYTGRIKSQPVYVHKETGVVYHNRNVMSSLQFN